MPFDVYYIITSIDVIIDYFFYFPRMLLSPDFTETYYTEDGQPVTVTRNYTVCIKLQL